MSWLGRNRDKEMSQNTADTTLALLSASINTDLHLPRISFDDRVVYVLDLGSRGTIGTVAPNGERSNVNSQSSRVVALASETLENGLTRDDYREFQRLADLIEMNGLTEQVGNMLVGLSGQTIESKATSLIFDFAENVVPHIRVGRTNYIVEFNCRLSGGLLHLKEIVETALQKSKAASSLWLKSIFYNTKPIVRGDIIVFNEHLEHNPAERFDYMVTEVYEQPVFRNNKPVDFIAINIADREVVAGLSYYVTKVGHIDSYFEKDSK